MIKSEIVYNKLSLSAIWVSSFLRLWFRAAIQDACLYFIQYSVFSDNFPWKKNKILFRQIFKIFFLEFCLNLKKSSVCFKFSYFFLNAMHWKRFFSILCFSISTPQELFLLYTKRQVDFIWRILFWNKTFKNWHPSINKKEIICSSSTVLFAL